MPDANTILMQSIRDKWGSAIDVAARNSTVPAAFLAALIAGESGGNPDAKRFERGVLSSLWEVLQGRASAYGSIARSSVMAFICDPTVVHPLGPSDVSTALQLLDGLATSWGLTQIMGYESIPFVIAISDLQAAGSGLRVTCRMLAIFGERFHLDLTKDFDAMLRCWNAGRPHQATYDPNYVPNALARMQIYQQLVAQGGA